jgi:hypothetical protein
MYEEYPLCGLEKASGGYFGGLFAKQLSHQILQSRAAPYARGDRSKRKEIGWMRMREREDTAGGESVEQRLEQEERECRTEAGAGGQRT